MAAFLAALPALAGLAGGGGGGGGGGGLTTGLKTAALAPLGVAQVIAQNKATKEMRESNKKRLEELQAQRDAGELGLTGMERQTLSRQFNEPIARASSESQSQAERIQAAMGGSGGASELSRLRTERDRTIGEAAQRAAFQIDERDAMAQREQMAELEGRLALKTQLQQDKINRIFGAAGQFAGASADLAGAAPGTFQASGMFGSRFNESEMSQLQQWMRQNPEEANQLYNEVVTQAEADAAAAAGGGTGDITSSGEG